MRRLASPQATYGTYICPKCGHLSEVRPPLRVLLNAVGIVVAMALIVWAIVALLGPEASHTHSLVMAVGAAGLLVIAFQGAKTGFTRAHVCLNCEVELVPLKSEEGRAAVAAHEEMSRARRDSLY